MAKADLLDKILSANRIHLLGGVSDAGKTRWALPAMLQWEQGLPLLGAKSNPCPWAYVIGDRLEQEAYDSMASMGIAPQAVRCIPAFGRHNKSWIEMLSAASKLQPVPELLVIEGFQDLCGDRKGDVKGFLGSVGAICEGCAEFPNGLTILGIVESPKQKPYEKYPNPRQRVSGVSAWSYHTSTIMLIEGVEGDEELLQPDRNFFVCSKNEKRRKLLASFDGQGRLIVP